MHVMSNASTVRLRRSCDWLKVEKQVKRYINEGNDVYSVACGGFEVRFDEASRNEASASVKAEPPLMSAVEKSVRLKLGKVMLNHVESLDDVIYEDLSDKETKWLEKNGFKAMSVFDMQRIVAAGMKALYGIELKTLNEKEGK